MMQYEFQHRLLSFLGAVSRNPLSAPYDAGELVAALEDAARTAVVGPPTYLTDTGSEGSWQDELETYNAGSELSDWSHLDTAELDGDHADLAGSSGDAETAQPEQLQGADVLDEPGVVETQLPLGNTQLAMPLAARLCVPPQPPAKRELPYARTSLSVWLASRRSGGQPARVLEPRLCFHERELVQQVRGWAWRVAGGWPDACGAVACLTSVPCSTLSLLTYPVCGMLALLQAIPHPCAALWLAQVMHVLKGVSTPGPAFELDAAAGVYATRPGVHLHCTSHGSIRSLLQRFARVGSALRRVQAFCAAARRAAGAQPGDWAAARGGKMLSLPTAAAFAAAVAAQERELQQQVLVVEAALAGGAQLTLLQLQQRTAALAEQALLLEGLVQRCCRSRDGPADTAAGLLTQLHDELQAHLLQARSQGAAQVASSRRAGLPAASRCPGAATSLRSAAAHTHALNWLPLQAASWRQCC
jgi:hypothetical protein